MNEADFKLANYYIDRLIDCFNELAIKLNHPSFFELNPEELKGYLERNSIGGGTKC